MKLSNLQLLPIVLIVSIFIYTAKWQSYIDAFLVVFLVLCLLGVISKKSNEILIRFLFVYIIAAIPIYLFITYSYFRLVSFDGLLWYLKKVLILKDDLIPTYLYKASPPFLVELFLALTWKLTTRNIMNLIFGIFSVLSVLTTYKLYSYLKIDKSTAKLAILIMILNPIFYTFAFGDFKIELFFLTLSNLSIIYFLKNVEFPNYKNAFLFGLLVSFSILTKITFVAVGAPMYLMYFFDIYKKKDQRSVRLFFISSLITIIPIILWIMIFGISVPWTQIEIPPYGRDRIVNLTLNEQIQNECYRQAKFIDFDRYFNGYSFKNFVVQPFLYPILKYDYFMFDHMFNVIKEPGILLYFGFFAYFILIRSKYFENREFKFIFFVYAFFFAYYVISIRTVFWYLIPLFPLLALVVPEIIENTKNELTKKILNTSVVSLLIVHIAYYTVYSYLLAIDQSDYSEGSNNWRYLRVNEQVEISDFINNIDEDALLINASPHPNHIFLTFVEDYDSRVIRNEYFFASSPLNDQELLKELKANNIRYMVLNDIKRVDDPVFFGCPLEDINRVDTFVEKYGDKVFEIEDFARIYKF